MPSAHRSANPPAQTGTLTFTNAPYTVTSVTTGSGSSAGSVSSGGFPNVFAGMLVTGLPGNPAGVYVASVSGNNITFSGNYAGITGSGPSTLTFTPTATLSANASASATVMANTNYMRGSPSNWSLLMYLLDALTPLPTLPRLCGCTPQGAPAPSS